MPLTLICIFYNPMANAQRNNELIGTWVQYQIGDKSDIICYADTLSFSFFSSQSYPPRELCENERVEES
jgi:hypothetical protein